MRTPRSAGDYPVGYGKPPPSTRFQPGHSGNPRGRPTRKPTLAERVQREARRLIEVVEEGARHRITREDALAKRLLQQALKGDARATQQVIELLGAVQAAAESARGTDEAELGGDQAVMQSLLQRLQGLGTAPPASAAPTPTVPATEPVAVAPKRPADQETAS